MQATGDRDKIRELTSRLQSIGFACRKCGKCCKEVSEDSNLVMVMPDEINVIIKATGLAWESVAEPYPEFIREDGDTRYTFGWCIRRESNRCMFLKAGKCSIYNHRPWICRTYPFRLDGKDIVTSPCPGTGTSVSLRMAERLSEELIRRDDLERAEEEQVRKVWDGGKMRLVPGKSVVIDCEGVWVLNG